MSRAYTKSCEASIRGRNVMRFLIWRSVVVHGDNNHGRSIGRENPENTIRTTVCITFGIIHVAFTQTDRIYLTRLYHRIINEG